MQKSGTKQAGLSAVELVVVAAVVAIIGIAVYTAIGQSNVQKQKAQGSQTQTTQTPKPAAKAITWMQTADGYQPDNTPPACPTQMVSQFPADITKVTSVLYPGQFRGGNYKPHGGLRFDHSGNAQITVKAPFDGTVIDGAAYKAEGAVNDVQYTFDVMNDCGMMYRVGHLLTLSPQMADIAKAFPAPVKGDSRTTRVNPGVKIAAGTVLATAVGTATDTNTFFDWGIYDWNQPNAISSNAAWLANPAHDNTLAKHGVCWFNLLAATDKQTILALPAGDPTSGKTSDYCK